MKGLNCQNVNGGWGHAHLEHIALRSYLFIHTSRRSLGIFVPTLIRPISTIDDFLGQVESLFEQKPRAGSALLEVDYEESERSNAYWAAIEADYNDISRYADPVDRLATMDADGVAAEVSFHGGLNRQPIPFFHAELKGPFGQWLPKTPEAHALRLAGMRAYNDWLANWCATDPSRLIGVGFVPVWDVDASAVEVKRVSAMGLRALNLPAPKLGVNTYNSPEYDPFWAACVEHGITLHSHVAEGEMLPTHPGPGSYSMILANLAFMSRRHLQHMIFGGVFDRFPELKIAFTEQAGAWVKPAFEIFDSIYEASSQERESPHIKELVRHKPSDYFFSNIYIGASSASRAEIRTAVDEGYTSRLMWGRDYPHPEGTWPVTGESLRMAFAGIPEAETRAILGSTAIDFLRLDRPRLTEIGAKIGPTIEELQSPPDGLPSAAPYSLGFRTVGPYA